MINYEDTIAILLCTYNGGRYIKEQLNSIVQQTYSRYVCYIHDDNSNDDTINIIDQYVDKYPDKFKKLSYTNLRYGSCENFMSLLKYASANCEERYFMLCDQDDVWLPSKIEESVNELKKNEKVNYPILIYSDQYVVDDKLNVIMDSANRLAGRSKYDNCFKRIVFRNTAAGCCMIFNKSLLELATMLCNINNIVMHDWWIMLIASYYDRAFYLDKPLMLYRQHGTNTLGVDNNNWKKKTLKYLKDFRNSIKIRSLQTQKCIAQMNELYKMDKKTDNTKELIRFLNITKKNKWIRMYYLWTNGYVGGNNLFLLFFV